MCARCNLFISWKDVWLDRRLKSCWLRECFLYRRQQFSYFLWVFSLVFYRPSPATEAAALVIPMLVWASSPKGLNSFQRFNTLCGSEFAELLFLVFFVRVFNPVMTILNSKSEIRAKFFSWLKWLGFWSMIYSRHSLIYVWLSIHNETLLLFTFVYCGPKQQSLNKLLYKFNKLCWTYLETEDSLLSKQIFNQLNMNQALIIITLFYLYFFALMRKKRANSGSVNWPVIVYSELLCQ